MSERGTPYAVPVTPLEMRTLSEDSALGRPYLFRQVSGRLVVVDAAGSPAIHIIDPQSGRVIRSLGGKGQGPGEFEGAWFIDSRPGDDGYAYIFDIALGRLTRIAVSDSAARIVEEAPLTIRFVPPIVGINEPVWVDSVSLIASGFLRPTRLVAFDPVSTERRFVGPPVPGPDSIPEDARVGGYFSRLAASPDRKRFVLATRYAGRIDIVDNAGRPLAMAETPYSFEPRFARRSHGFDLDPSQSGSYVGYCDVATTTNRIFALFSGRAYSDSGSDQGRYIHVFSWQGKFMYVLETPVDLVSIAVDEAAGTLYGLTFSPSPAIFAFPIPRSVLEASSAEINARAKSSNE